MQKSARLVEKYMDYIFKILLPCSMRTVFMQPDNMSLAMGSCVVFIEQEDFIKVWANELYDMELNNIPYNSLTLAEKQRVDAYNMCEEAFLCSEKKPVPLARIGDFLDGKVSLVNGITRTSWLIHDETIHLPFVCSRLSVPVFKKHLYKPLFFGLLDYE